jgi:hypothetical protein
MGFKQTILDAVNVPLKLAGAALVPARELEQMRQLREAMDLPTFQLGPTRFECFAHRYNCGWPRLASHTERSVELAVADKALDEWPEALEIGAVTPYYWPKRVKEIADPTDTHPLVTQHQGIETLEIRGRNVLSISTFEHIGRGDYGLQADPPAAGRALDKLLAEASAFLVTFAAGYNAWLDEHVLNRNDLAKRLLVRDASGVGWREMPAAREHLRPYGSSGGNAVFFLHRGLRVLA